jgi:alkanesulfonate monooxygenase SsuD/methylene tetrahydromethanopterin reductase-like flavin-dependent oxidoreductase (luciferase family)
LKVGIKTSQGGYSYKELSDVWNNAERLGFDSAFLYDHLTGVGNPNDLCLEAFSTLSALARDTTRLRIGVMAACVNYRNPALLAKIASTIDHISNGRLVLGLGAGWNETEMRSYGYHFPSVSERIDQLFETIQVIRSMWREDKASFKGNNYFIDSAVNIPKPVQKFPPIWVGIMKGTRKLPCMAVRDADGFNTIAPLDICEKIINAAEEERLRIGRERSAFTYSIQVSILAGSERELQMIADVEASKRRMTAASYFESLKLQGWLVGSPEHCADTLAKYRSQGIDYMLLAVGSDKLGWTLEVVKDKLLPLL